VGATPERLRWAVDLLAVEPSHRILEIGPGRGVALELISERLDEGTAIGIERSATAVAAARQRLRPAIERGVADVRHIAVEDADYPPATFDTVFAVNVNTFWTRDARADLARIRRWLVPGGRLILVYEPPSADRAEAVASSVGDAMRAVEFEVGIATGGTSSGAALIAIIGSVAPSSPSP
jgi:cyclopropane fatty-acyl-phospholipid synthase-like methyltransferase